MEIKVAPYYTDIIIRNINSGKYNNEVEFIQAGLDLLDKKSKQFARIEKALLIG